MIDFCKQNSAGLAQVLAGLGTVGPRKSVVIRTAAAGLVQVWVGLVVCARLNSAKQRRCRFGPGLVRFGSGGWPTSMANSITGTGLAQVWSGLGPEVPGEFCDRPDGGEPQVLRWGRSPSQLRYTHSQRQAPLDPV